MLTKSSEKTLSKLVAIGAALTTVFLISESVTDPVNVPKLMCLGVFSLAAIGMIFVESFVERLKSSKLIWSLGLLFLGFGLLSTLNTNSPLSQAIYGAYGRSNGYLTYVFLTAILLAVSSFSRLDSLQRLIYGFFIAGIINIAYCAWALVFGDFISWYNPYGEILGTFGNPNFIGAFLGMFIAAYFAFGIANSSSKYFKYSLAIVLPVTAIEIIASSAIQGRVVGAAGIFLVGFFYIRSKYRAYVVSIYVFLGSVAGIFALLGALQIGPLTSFIYKNSVSFRGQYWLAGWNTGQSNPITGVGMDAFGDWYRRARDIHALERPGVNVVVNAAHNVPIDMFAFGGWPLFLTYLAIMAIGGWSLLKSIRRSKSYDPILVVLTTTWVGYQLQSIISINQIGLAIWGWVLTGAAIAYERATRTQLDTNGGSSRNLRRDSSQHSKSILAAFVFGLLGLFLTLPPLVSDAKWRNAQVSQNLEQLESTMIPGYFNPQNSMRYITNIQTLENNNLPEFAQKYALEAVKWNPEAYDLWRLLFLIKSSTPVEKSVAIENMKRLDPLNPDVTAIK